MILNRTIAPSQLLPTADAKAHLRVDSSVDDALIDTYIAAAEAHLDGPNGRVGKPLGTQTWTMARERVTGRTWVKIPLAPVQSVTAISYYDSDETSQSLTVSDFDILKNEDAAWIRPKSNTNWPTMYDRPDALTLTVQCGFGAVSDVPENIMQAVRFLLSHYYENRESVVMNAKPVVVPQAVDDLIGQSRVGWIGA